MRNRLFVLSYSLLLTMTIGFIMPTAGQSRKDIKKAEDLIREADKAFKQRNYRNAIDNYSQAIAIVPNNPAPHFWKGVAHSYLKENEPALNELNNAASLGYKPELDIYKARFPVNYDLKKYDEAL